MIRAYRGWVINPIGKTLLKAERRGDVLIDSDISEIKQEIDRLSIAELRTEPERSAQKSCRWYQLRTGRCMCEWCDQYDELVSEHYCGHCTEWDRKETMSDDEIERKLFDRV